MKMTRVLLVIALLVPAFVSAEEWTKEQKEVLAFEEACISTKNVDELMDCFHDDFVGIGIGMGSVPTSKADRHKLIANDFAISDGELVLFKPLSVYVNGNMAVVSYVTTTKVTDKVTDKVTSVQQRWTDVCLKEGGKWFWISDHGKELSSD